MKSSLVFFIVITLLTFFSFAGLMYYSLEHLDPLDVPAEVKEGKQVWQEKGCVECHTLFGNGGYVAPDLTKTLSRRKPEWIKKFFADPPVVRPSRQKLHMELTPEETQKILDFLEFTNKIVIQGGWPPEPLNFSESR